MTQISAPPPPGLIRLGRTPSLTQYLRSLWERRDFALTNARDELRGQHMDTALGNLWHLLNPILLVAIYFLVFGLIFRATRGLDNFLAYLAIGIFGFHWSTKAITGGAKAIVSNEGLIRSLQFPRALLPISTVLQETLAFLPGVLVMALVVLATGEPLTPTWLIVVPIFALQLTFNLGAGFVAARAADLFRDVLNLLPYLFRLAFYGSGVIYAVDVRFSQLFESEVFGNPWVIRVFIANPFFCFITLWRESLMTSDPTPIDMRWIWLSAVSWAIVLLVAGLLIVRAGEKHYGRG